MKVARRAAIPPFYVMQVMKAAQEREAAGADVLHLEVGQPSTGAPGPVRHHAAAALTGDLLRYTDADGSPVLRRAIAGWYAVREGVVVDPGRIAVTTGASGACVLVFLAAFDAGDRVAVARPGYPCYRNMLHALGCEVVDLPVTAASGFQPTADMVAALHAAAPLAGVVIASPSNPTGTVIDGPAMAELVATCRDRSIRLVVDEIYRGITYGTPPPSALVADPDVVVINSFSKYFSMTGWRLGWAVLPDELVGPVERLAQNLTVAPPTLAQIGAEAAFGADAVEELDLHVVRYAANRDLLADGLRAAGLRGFVVPEGAFYLWCDIGPLIDAGATESAEALCGTWLADLGVAVTPGIDFDPVDGQRAVRFSFAGATADIVEAVRRLTEWCTQGGGAGGPTWS